MACLTVDNWGPLLGRMLQRRLPRFCCRYRHDIAAMLLLQHVPVAEATAFESLQAFIKEMTYIADFPCICCGQLHFFSPCCVLAKNVEAYSTLDCLGQFCLEENLAVWKFLAHGSLWLCRTCKSSVDCLQWPLKNAYLLLGLRPQTSATNVKKKHFQDFEGKSGPIQD